MTRKERQEARPERYREYAENAAKQATAAFKASNYTVVNIPIALANEQIEKAAGEYSAKATEKNEVYNSEFVQELAVAFKRGAQYSISHQWVSVDEMLPEEGEHVLFARYNTIEKAKFSKVGKPHFIMEWNRQNDFDIYYLGDGITHWMPLPPLNFVRN